MTELTNRDPEPRYPRPSWRGLGVFWALVLGAMVAGGALLQTVGPPGDSPGGPARDRVPVAQSAGPGTATRAASVQTSANPTSEAAPGPSRDAIAGLLAKVQAKITDSPDGVPPGNGAADMLKRVAAALPNASPQDRELANDMAADLYDRAKAALQAGKVDEEQHWLALGSILAPPPDIKPSGPEGTTRTAQAQGSTPSAAQPRQDITPNEAEMEQPAPERTRSTAAGPSRDIASAGTADQAPQQPGAASAPVPAPAEARAAEPGAQEDTAQAANSSDASSTATGAQQASGKSLAIHVLASSASAQEEKLKQLTARLRSNFDQTEMHTEADVPRTAVVVYGAPADHSTAKDVGRVLGAMGYPWHLERITTDRGDATSRTVDVWLPSDEHDPQEFRPRRRVHFRPRAWFPGWLPFWF